VADLMKLCIYARKLITNDEIRAHMEKSNPDALKLLHGIVFDGEYITSAVSTDRKDGKS
jgi:hypothetical protein